MGVPAETRVSLIRPCGSGEHLKKNSQQDRYTAAEDRGGGGGGLENEGE